MQMNTKKSECLELYVQKTEILSTEMICADDSSEEKLFIWFKAERTFPHVVPYSFYMQAN